MDTKEICRLCLKGKNITLIWVFDKRFQDNNHMKDLILKTTGLEITKQDEISQKICPKCGEVIIKFYEFRQQCLKSDQFLKEQQKKQLQMKKPDPSILELFKKYPRIHLPKLCIYENISPVVEMEMDKVENYFKSKNKNFERQVQLMNLGKQNQKSKEMVSPISIKFVQDKSSYEVVHKTSKEEHDFNLKNHRKRRVSDSEQHCASKKIITESNFPRTEAVIMRRQSTGPNELNPKNKKLYTYLMEELEASETRTVPNLTKIPPNCQLNPDIVSNITKSVAIEILHQNKSNEILKSTKTSSDCNQTNSHLVHTLDPMRNMDIPNYLGIIPINNSNYLPLNRHLPLNPSTFGEPSKAVTENLITEAVTKTKTYPNLTETFEVSTKPLDCLDKTAPEIPNSNLNLMEKSVLSKEFQNRKRDNSVPTKSNVPPEQFVEDNLKPCNVVTINLVTEVTKTKTYASSTETFEVSMKPLDCLEKTVPEVPNSNLNLMEKSVLSKEFQNRKRDNSGQQNNSVSAKSNVPPEQFVQDNLKSSKIVTINLVTEVTKTKTYPRSTETFEVSMKPLDCLDKTVPEVPNSNLNVMEKSVLNKEFQNRNRDNSSQQNNSVSTKLNVPSERFIEDKLKPSKVVTINLVTELVTKTYPTYAQTFEAFMKPLDSLNKTVPYVPNSNLNLIERSVLNKEFQNRKEDNSSQQNNSVPSKSNVPSEVVTKTCPNSTQTFEASMNLLDSLNTTLLEIPNSNLNLMEKSVLNKKFQNRKEDNLSQQNNSVPSKSNVPSERFIGDKVKPTKTVTKNLITEVVTKTYPNLTQSFEASMNLLDSLNTTLLEIPNSNLNLMEKSVLNKEFQNREGDNSSQQNNSMPSKSNVHSERFIEDKLKFTQVIVEPKKVIAEKSIKLSDLHMKPQIQQETAVVNFSDHLPKPYHVLDSVLHCTTLKSNSMITDKAITNAEFSCNFCREMFASNKSRESHLKICYVKEAVEVTSYVLLEKVELPTIASCNKIDEVINIISDDDDDDDEKAIKHNPILENKKVAKSEDKKEVATPVLTNNAGCQPILNLIPELQIKNSRFSNIDFKSNSVNILKSLVECFKNQPESFQNSQTDITSESPELDEIVFEFKKKPNNDCILTKRTGSLVLQNLKSFVDLYKIPIHINNGNRFEIIYKEDVPSRKERNYEDWKDLALIDMQVDENTSRDTPLSTVLKESSNEVQNLASNSNSEKTSLIHSTEVQQNLALRSIDSINRELSEVEKIGQLSTPYKPSTPNNRRLSETLPDLSYLDELFVDELNNTNNMNVVSNTDGTVHSFDRGGSNIPNQNEFLNIPQMASSNNSQQNSYHMEHQNFLRLQNLQNSLRLNQQNSLRLNQKNSLRLNQQNSLRLNQQNSLRLNQQNSLRLNQQNSFDLNLENGFSQTVNLQQNISGSGEYQNHSNFTTGINSNVTTLSANDISTLGQAFNKEESGFRNNVENNIDKKQQNLKKSKKVITSGLFFPPQNTLNYEKNNRPMTMNIRPPPPSYQQALKSNQIFQETYSMPNNQTAHYYPYSNHIVNISRKSITPNVCVPPTFSYTTNMNNGAGGNVVVRQEYTNSDIVNDNNNSSNIRVRPLKDMK